MRFFGTALALVLALGFVPAASAVDWSKHADEEVVQVVTTDEDGAARTTKVWIVVVDGEAYIRTGGTRWGKNVERNQDVRLLAQGAEYDLRVEFVTDEALRARVTQALREKYGWPDRMLSVFRGGSPKIMRLVPRGDA
jgi:hypothetical protein